MSFWEELKRRNVYKVGVAYAIVAWLLIQFAAIAFPHLDFPSWAVPFVIIILIIGFPIVLIIAWAFEVTPEGIKRTKEVPLAESITHLTGRKLNYILAGVIVLAVAYIVFDKYYLDRQATVTEQVPAVGEVAKTQETIAVLPFTDLSPEKDQEYFVDGLSEEILNFLCQISGLEVMGKTSSFYFKGKNKKAQEIANELSVEYLLEGSVRKDGDSLRITAQLLRGKDGFHLWSKTYDREMKDIFAVQEDIATAVANELKITLGIGKSFKQLGGTDNVKAYEHYLVAKGLIGKGSPDNYFTLGIANLEQESIDAAIELDPNFALAWVWRARIHAFWSLVKPIREASAERVAALNAVSKAIELEPNLAAGYYSQGSIKSINADFVGAESTFQKAIELTTEPFWEASITIVPYYLSVGHLKKAYEMIDVSRRSDPLNEDNRDYYMYCLALIGETKQAEDEYKRIKSLVGENQWDDYAIAEIRLGTKNILSRDDIVYSDPIYDAAKKYFDSPEKTLSELRQLYAGRDISFWDLKGISLWAAFLGDPEFAMDAMEKGNNMINTSIENFWWPVMKEVRQTPRFKALLKKIGLVDYWNKFGWPDICRPMDNGDFECD